MKKILLLVAITVISTLFLTACNSETEEERLYREAMEMITDVIAQIQSDIAPPIEQEEPQQTPPPEEAPAPVFADLSLPIIVQERTFYAPFWPQQVFYISTDGEFIQGWLTNQGYEWETIDTNVRSFKRNPLYPLALFYIKDDNTLWGVGPNRNGLLGDGTGIDRDEAVLVLENVASVHLFVTVAYALQIDGTLWTWGSGNFSPVHVADNVAHIIDTDRHDRRIIYFQANNGGIYRRMADGEIVRIIPEPVYYITTTLTHFINLERSLIHRVEYEEIATNVANVFLSTRNNLFFITSDGVLWGMGDNRDGELGDNTRVPRPEPVRIAEDVVYARAYAFLKQDGTFWTWNQSNPTPQQTFENVVKVDGTHMHFTDGSVIANFSIRSEPDMYNVRMPRTFTVE